MSRKVGIILSAIIAIIAGLWVWAAVIPKDSIQIGGSTSVSNVMTNLEKAYKNYQEENNKGKKPDQFIYSSVGSSGGINSAKSGTYKMGFISKNLDNSVSYVKPNNVDFTKISEISKRQEAIKNYFIESKKTAKKDDMHYIQIANDAIIIVYQAPKWFEDKYSDKFDIDVDANGVSDKAKALVQHIYQGHYKWSEVARDLTGDTPDTKDGGDAEIQPFAGSAGSGTRTVFDNVFELTSNTNAQTFPSVGPSDGFMYSSINKNTIGYLSMNYLKQIQDNTKLRAVKVNNVDPKDKSFGAKSIKDANDIKDGDKVYALTRPYIGLVKANSSDADLVRMANFLGWIAQAKADDKSNVADQYSSAGIAPEFKLDDETLLPKENKQKEEKVEEQSLTTNSELKENILNAYVRKD